MASLVGNVGARMVCCVALSGSVDQGYPFQGYSPFLLEIGVKKCR